MNRHTLLLNLLAACLLFAPAASPASKPPATPREDVTEVIHGVSITDPYRWLEDQNSPQTRAWLKEQNAYTRSVLDIVPQRAAILERLEALMKVTTVSIPRKRGGRYFYTRRSAAQNKAVICVREGERGAERVLVDPNRMEETVTASIGAVSDDGRVLACRLQRGGEDEVAIQLLDADSGRILPDQFPRARYHALSFQPDGRGVYFAKIVKEGCRVYYHEIGKAGPEDREVFGKDYNPTYFTSCSVSSNGRWLTCRASKGSTADDAEYFVRDLKDGGELRQVVKGIKARFQGGVGGDRLLLSTDWKAPNYRVLSIDLNNPAQENWREIIPESANAITDMALVGGHIAVSRMVNVKTQIGIYTPEGKLVREIPVPGFGTTGGPAGEWQSDEAFYSFDSIGQPDTIYSYSVSTGKQRVWSKQQAPVDPAPVELKQVWYTAKDGTKVPMFVAHKKGLKLDGNNPTYLTGYGGFLLTETPEFSAASALWVESGGVWAIPSLRGGGEFGEKWHRAGMLENKQNVFDDFLAAAEWLIASRYTRPAKLAIAGGSNGGLLVGAAFTQRPELFGAVLCGVPLLDMVRYHKFKVARWWVPEYGSSDDPKQFEFIYRYSPYHRVKAGTEYPAIMIHTGDSDTRVDPLHARKMAALLQAATGSDKPVLLHYDTDAGHARGLPIKKQIEQQADRLTFLFWQLDWKTGR